MRERLTASQAADILGVDKRTLLRFVRGGKLRSYRTPGGQHRFRREDVERLAAGSGNSSGPSSSLIQNKRDEIEALSLEVQARRAKRELARIEAEDAEAEAESRELDRERKEMEAHARAARAAEAARQERERKHREAKESWIEFALDLLPTDAPPSVKTTTVKFMRQAYAELPEEYWDGCADDPDIADIANEAAAKAVAPLQRHNEIERIIEGAPAALPWQCRSILPSHPTEWQVRAKEQARKAIAVLSEDCSIEELRHAASEAVRRVRSEYTQRETEKQHCEQIEAAMLWLTGDEEKVVRNELAELPIGCGRAEMERAKGRALAPIRAAGDAKRREESERFQSQIAAQIAQSRAESQTDAVLLHVRECIDELCDEDEDRDLHFGQRHELAEEIKKELRPKFVQGFLRDDLDEETARELIDEAVNREI